jgi:tRNA(Ile)-lysidine synthetase-like protein
MGAWLPSGLKLGRTRDAVTIGVADFRMLDPPDLELPLMGSGTAILIPNPGEYEVEWSGWVFRVSRYEGPRTGPGWKIVLQNPWEAPVSGDVLQWPLRLRTHQPGDRFYPQGAGGSQKVADFMINAKIPAAWRDSLPLLVAGDAIVWVCGWRVDERFIVRPETKQILVARFERS